MGNQHGFFNCNYLAAVLLMVLAGGSFAFGGEIHDAALAGDLAKVKALIKADPALVFSTNIPGWTPLHYAAANGYTNLVVFLLAGKADINATETNGRTPLHLAARNGYEDVVSLLVASKAEVNLQDRYGHTALGLAAMAHSKGVVAFLLAHQARASGIFEAVEAGDMATIQSQLQHDPHLISSTNHANQTLLHMAAYCDQTYAAALLLDRHVDINARDLAGETPLHMAATAGSANVAAMLLANLADVNARDKYGVTPLFTAVRLDDKPMAELLLAGKADINVKNSFGWTLLQQARSKGMVALLRQYGAHK